MSATLFSQSVCQRLRADNNVDEISAAAALDMNNTNSSSVLSNGLASVLPHGTNENNSSSMSTLVSHGAVDCDSSLGVSRCSDSCKAGEATVGTAERRIDGCCQANKTVKNV